MSYLATLLASPPAAELLLRRLLLPAAGMVLLLVVLLQLRRQAQMAGLPGTARRRFAALVGLALSVLLVTLAAFLFVGPLSSPLRATQRAMSGGLDRALPGHSGGPRATAAPARILAPEPSAVTLQSGDLTPGYHVLNANKASFSSGDDAYPSWDVLFEPDPDNRAPAYPLVESLVVVYPSVAAASSSLEAQSSADRAGGAAAYVLLPKLGDQTAVWVEKAANRPDSLVVRVTWRYLNVLGQVSMLSSASTVHPEQTLTLAAVEQERIKTHAPSAQPVPASR